MNHVFELAASLGDALKEDARLQRLEAAKKAYDDNPDLQKAMVEYDVQQKALQTEVTRPEQDTMLIDSIQQRINTLYHDIVEHPVYRELNEAQNEVNKLISGRTFKTDDGKTHTASICDECIEACSEIIDNDYQKMVTANSPVNFNEIVDKDQAKE